VIIKPAIISQQSLTLKVYGRQRPSRVQFHMPKLGDTIQRARHIEAELHQLAPLPPLSFCIVLQAQDAAKMSLTYGVVGTTTTLSVIGLCEISLLDPELQAANVCRSDMLLTGDGEAFNVCPISACGRQCN
jgi:hypothetical protein